MKALEKGSLQENRIEEEAKVESGICGGRGIRRGGRWRWRPRCLAGGGAAEEVEGVEEVEGCVRFIASSNSCSISPQSS